MRTCFLTSLVWLAFSSRAEPSEPAPISVPFGGNPSTDQIYDPQVPEAEESHDAFHVTGKFGLGAFFVTQPGIASFSQATVPLMFDIEYLLSSYSIGLRGEGSVDFLFLGSGAGGSSFRRIDLGVSALYYFHVRSLELRAGIGTQFLTGVSRPVSFGYFNTLSTRLIAEATLPINNESKLELHISYSPPFFQVARLRDDNLALFSEIRYARNDVVDKKWAHIGLQGRTFKFSSAGRDFFFNYVGLTFGVLLI